MNPSHHDIVIAGGGIIGLSCALYLREAGYGVTLVEPGELAGGASRGNAGALAYAEILPLAAPGIITRALRWLSDPMGPLSLPPAYLPRMLPWLLHMCRASRPRRYLAGINAQSALMCLAKSEMTAMMERTGLDSHIRTNGVLELYEGSKSFRAAGETMRRRAMHGINSRVVQGHELAQLQPGLDARFTHGVFVSDWQTLADPHAFACAIGRQAIDGGVQLLQNRVTGLTPASAGGIVHLDDGTSLQARHIIVAAGAWSHQLAACLGERIPLETERGYNTSLAPDAFELRHQLSFVDHGFVISPLDCGIRVGGAVELAGLERKPDFRRADYMLDKAKAFLPGLRTENGTRWMGFRPSLPDSLPVIGPSARHRAFIYAFGHGHLGLTQSAATARLVRDLITGQEPAIDMHPYRAGRFRAFTGFLDQPSCNA